MLVQRYFEKKTLEEPNVLAVRNAMEWAEMILNEVYD